ncbi:MAG: hypothetical protein U0790_19110 [Isosphaeraceae bacterium]
MIPSSPDPLRSGGESRAAGSPPLAPPKPTYQIILRHLAKLRDGARALGRLFEADESPPADPAGGQAVAASTDKSALKSRIERHMGLVDRALRRIRDLNPGARPRSELPHETHQRIEDQQRTLHDIVGAELHYWSAAIESSPLDRFDEIEQAWVRRIIRLAELIGVDQEHEEHLTFLKDWAALEHP